MKRLTEREEYDYINDRKGSAFTYTDIRFCGDCYVGEVIDKLAYYEDLEEQGLLLKLPRHEFVENEVETINKQKAKEVLEKLFSDSTGEDYPFTEEFAEAVRIAIQVLEQPQKNCFECSRRKFYQQGYEDGYKDGLQ